MAIKRYAGDKFAGLAADIKPTNVLGGSTFFEIDTQKVFVYDGSSWVEIDYSDAAHTHPASDIVSGTFADARISQSSVRQHIDKVYVDSLNVDADTLDGNDSTAFEFIANKGVAGGYAPLDGNAKIPTTHLPALAITETFVVADITARNALTVQEGDVAIVTDASADPNVDSGGETYIWDGAAWQRTLSPTDSVQSINGQTGVVSLDTDDIPEGINNLYYTQARFDSAFSAKSTTDLSEGTNLYFTNERVDDRVNNLLVAGTGISLTYDDVANTLTITGTATAAPGGANSDVQYNNGGAFGGSSKFQFDPTAETLKLTGYNIIREPGAVVPAINRGEAGLYVETEVISTNTVTRVMLRLSNGNDRQIASFIEPT